MGAGGAAGQPAAQPAGPEQEAAALRAWLSASKDPDALRAELDSLRSDVAAVKALEEEVQAARKLLESRDSLRAELSSLAPRAAIAERMKAQVAALQAACAESESLSARISALTPDAEKLPTLKAQLSRVQAASIEARALEARLAEMERGGRGEEELLVRGGRAEGLRHACRSLLEEMTCKQTFQVPDSAATL
jgi:prefoldin subunit 5